MGETAALPITARTQEYKMVKRASEGAICPMAAKFRLNDTTQVENMVQRKTCFE
ncbi:hypothetical protein GJ744_004129 [Endocarpon pusillum]|uniref:Uncharacterized protein n=1 Tax=Endocarpon pusillum TaxID=364733 RepID=A0A8H7E9B4_9EURO|nr:hypothetical protein GJ744_004129 [Endocarpon pusillum]